MEIKDKLAALAAFYERSLKNPKLVADVPTSGSYARKVRSLARLGRRSQEEVALLEELVEELRRAFKIVDDLIDEDETRDNALSFWVVHGPEATVEQAAWHVKKARAIARRLGVERLFELRLQEIIEGARLEVELESGWRPPDPALTWYRIAQKESAFRLFIAEALGCPPEVCEAARQDGIAAQMLDDGLSALYGKEGRPPGGTDERLGRLTYMRAFSVSPEEAVQRGKELKARVRRILESAN